MVSLKKRLGSFIIMLSLLTTLLPVTLQAQSAPVAKEFSKEDFVCLLADAVGTEKTTPAKRYENVSGDAQYCVQAFVDRRVYSEKRIASIFESDKPFNLMVSYNLTLRFFGFNDIYTVDETAFKVAFPGLNPNAFYGPTMSRALSLKLIDPKNQNYDPLRPVTEADAVKSAAQMQQLLELIGEQPVVEDLIVPSFQPTISGNGSLAQDPAYGILEDVYSQLRTEYLYNDDIDDTDLIYKAIRGMMEGLDTYSVFFNRQEADQFAQSVNGEFEGVGISLEVNNAGELEVITPITGSPAADAGIEPGDVITKIDGEAVGNPANIEAAIAKIKGEVGTKVSLTVRRGSQTLSFTLTRAAITLPDVEASIENGVLVISLYTFANDTDISLREQLQTLNLTNLDGVVIDVRNNPGGYLAAAIGLADLFIPKGEVITRLEGPNVEITEVAVSEPLISGVPVAVVVNGGSASASEVLAAALQDQLDATIVGEQSFGKGVVQNLTRYTDGSTLKLTVADWLSPNGLSLNEVGITPDVVVTDRNQQLQRAKDLF